MKKLLTGFLAGLLTALTLGAAPALADWSPSGPIKLWIGFGAGGETDTLGRLVAERMSEATGWNIVVENKPGGGGMAMFTQLANMPADGQTIGMGVTMPVLVNLTVRPGEVPFDLDSFDYLGTVALAQLALVAPADAPFDDFEGLVEYSRSGDGALIGFDAPPQELLMKFIEREASPGFRLLSLESSAEGVQNLLGGHVDAAFSAGAHIPYLETGELKMIATANASRASYAPDTPTIKEAGYDIYVDPWFYIAAPDGLPDDAKTALADAIAKALASDAVAQAIEQAMHTEPADMGPDETKKMMQDGLKNVGALFGK